MEQLTGQDAQFLFMEDADIVAHITGIHICDQSTAPGGVVRFKKIVATIEDRLKTAPMFRRKLLHVPMDLDLPYWVDDPHFDIENHVFHARLPKPSDWRQLCIQIARYHSRPLNMGRPLWEMYILEGLDQLDGVPKGSFALISKVHHAIADGTTALKLLGALTDMSPDGPALYRFPGRKLKQDTPTTAQMFRRAVINNTASQIRLTAAIGKSAPQIARAALKASQSQLRRQAKSKSAAPIFGDEVSPRKCFDATEFDLKEIKAIRAVFKEAKINDIIIAICAGGIRKYLMSKQELPRETLMATAPINARAKNDEKGRQPKEKGGNQITAMNVPLFTNIEHPVERLKSIVLATHKAKNAEDGVSARVLTDFTKHIPAAAMALGGRMAIRGASNNQPISNIIISNMAGPQSPIYFCGAEMLSIYGMAPVGGGVGLFIATPSYNNKLAISVTSTREIVPDTPFLMECFQESFDELRNAAQRRIPSNENAKQKKPAPEAPGAATKDTSPGAAKR